MWTGVITRDVPDGKTISIRPIGPELIFDSSIRKSMEDLLEHRGNVLFSPILVKKDELPNDLESGRLSLAELVEFGHTATKAKARFVNQPQYPTSDGRDANLNRQ